MNEEIKWRFKGNNYTTEFGLDTSDMETFKKDPIASLARESCQNSIDAKAEGEGKVKIEFQLFEINKEDIPGEKRLEEEIESCKEYRKANKKIKDAEQLEKMLASIKREKIKCLRISDFNTKGLTGVSSRGQTAFYLLTKGSGITDKTGTSGGSKGIGKFASFVASGFNTVFYSTQTIENEVGYIGISKLCSTTMPGTDELTQGIGYYGSDEKNSPMLEQLKLDKSFTRTTPGTDIYILGFNEQPTWKQEIITKILDSFMAAIIFGDLEVKVDTVVINKETLRRIVNSEELILSNAKRHIKSQYLLLTEAEGVQTKEIEIDTYGKAKIYVKGFNKEESYLATNECVMVRYPYMKIKSFKNISTIPCSAICIIQDDDLNKTLRDIENPQHTDWELKRIEDMGLRREVSNMIQQLKTEIQKFIYEVLSSSQNEQLDIEGASDYLPEVDENNGMDEGEETQVIVGERPTISKSIKNKAKSKIGIEEDENGNALQPDIGSHEPGEGSPVPHGTNHGHGGGPHDTDTEGGFNEEGDQEILKIVPLKGMQYRLFVVDKKSGKYVISFNSLYEEKNCELEMYYLDDSNTKYNINIIDCVVNGTKAEIKNGKAVKIPLHNGRTKIEVITDLKELYACEVKMYANKE